MNITVININVTDDNNNLINFNNVDWYMTFTIKIDYKDLNDPNQKFLSIVKIIILIKIVSVKINMLYYIII